MWNRANGLYINRFGEQLRKELDAISNSGKFYVNLSKIKIGAGAITDFRKQLSAVINTINLDKGTSVTLTAENIGEVKSKLKDAGDAAEEAARKVAAFKVQMEALGHQKSVVQRSLNGLVDSGVSESESQRVASLVEQYRLWAVSVETVRASKEATSDEYRLSLEAEGAAILENINRIYAERQAAEEAAAAEAAAARSAEAANKEKMATLNEVIAAYKKVSTYIDKNPRIDGTELEQLKIINLRKEMIESAKDEFDYEADIADKVKEIADLQARIDQLALDDSRSAQAERNTLMQELEEKQKDLADTQRDHSVEAQTNALDKMGEDYESDKEAELELLRSTVNSSEELWTAFYQTLLGQSVSVGASIDAEISSAWIRAAEAVRQYSDAVGGVSGVGTVVSNVPKYHDGGVVDEANLSKDEVLAILQKGEVVLNEAKQKSLYRIIDFQAELSKRLGVVIGTLPTISAPASGIKDTMSGLTQDIIGGTAQSLVFEPHFEVNITHSGEMADTDAKAYGERIADVAIDKLYSAFERRGINSTRGSRLKP